LRVLRSESPSRRGGRVHGDTPQRSEDVGHGTGASGGGREARPFFVNRSPAPAWCGAVSCGALRSTRRRRGPVGCFDGTPNAVPNDPNRARPRTGGWGRTHFLTQPPTRSPGHLRPGATATGVPPSSTRVYPGGGFCSRGSVVGTPSADRPGGSCRGDGFGTDARAGWSRFDGPTPRCPCLRQHPPGSGRGGSRAAHQGRQRRGRSPLGSF
jgi:hypothetical protein